MIKNKPAGFTLVEVIVSVVILTIGMTIAASVMQGIIHKIFQSSRKTQAVYLAQSTLETLLISDYDDDDLDPGEHSHPLISVSASGDTAGVFTLTWNISENDPVDNAKLINVTVTWPRQNNEIESISLTTIKIN